MNVAAPHSEPLPTVTILGLPFVACSPQRIINYMAENGGLLVAPAAPALADIPTHTTYHRALQAADVVIADSSFMVACWRLIGGRALPRISGLRLFEAWMQGMDKERILQTFWIHPNEDTQQAHIQWLESQGWSTQHHQHYLAPLYNPDQLEDPELLRRINEHLPKWVVINLGGGTQEVLGHYLREGMAYSPAFICTGAAMSFLSGAQVRIPRWADRTGLGWLFRCFWRPRIYPSRYCRGLKVLPLLLRYRDRTPTT